MEQQRGRDGTVSLPSHEFAAILERAAEQGARRALADFDLDSRDAALDIRD